ncbi:hypothetical protein LPUS_03277 [Lasallia pustulata]|uniref:Retrovirus-related Pol polyprotein from transposon TNT 1-94-like beta-barrel domain-containing protein n=1 Tax=Lasallia pustulata TaxID=136370 RepID=A0A1W5CUG9_9LECA|nr:hypothetical protein LPUS_03277 [Lasallia pustulata]
MLYSFQGLSSIPKLKGSENWEAWIKALESVARLNGVWNVFTDAMKQPIEPSINEEDLNYDVKMDRFERQTENLKDAAPHTQLEFLKCQYEVTGYTAIHQALVKLWTYHLSADYASPTDFADKIKKAKTKLKDINEKGNQIELSLKYVVKQLIQRELYANTTNNTLTDNPKGLKTDTRGGSKQQSKGGLDNKRNCSKKDAENCGHRNSKTHVNQNCWYKHPDQANQRWLEHNKDKLDEYQKAKKPKKDKVKKDKANATKANNSIQGEKKNESRSLMARAGATQTEEKDSVWYMDSAASTHMTYNLTEFHGSMRLSSQYITLADGSKIKAQGVGTIIIAVQVNGKETKINVLNVQYSPELDSKLISLGTLEKKGYYFIGRNGQLKLYDKDNSVVLEGPSTIPVIDTSETANSGDGEAVEADNPNDTDKEIEASTAHNQEVIDCQLRQIRCIRQEIKYEENKRELEKLNAHRREGPKAAMIMPENDGGFTPGDFIIWAGTYLEKTAMSNWRKQKEQHNHAWVTYDNYLKVLEQNLSPSEDTDKQNIVTFNAAKPNANNTITSWYKKLYKLYRFLPDTYKQIGEAPI